MSIIQQNLVSFAYVATKIVRKEQSKILLE